MKKRRRAAPWVGLFTVGIVFSLGFHLILTALGVPQDVQRGIGIPVGLLVGSIVMLFLMEWTDDER